MKNKKGFTLLEVLVVSIFIISTLTFLFTQFLILKKSYDYSFRYDTVEGMYGAKNVAKYLKSFSYKYKEKVDDNFPIYHLECAQNDADVLYENLCTSLFENLSIKNVYITRENMEKVKENIRTDSYSENLRQYVKRKKVDNISGAYRLIVEYYDKTIASIVLEGGE